MQIFDRDVFAHVSLPPKASCACRFRLFLSGISYKDRDYDSLRSLSTACTLHPLFVWTHLIRVVILSRIEVAAKGISRTSKEGR
jgi:hypothetical protein